ncbi:hypothetical protein PVAP13_5NG621101 [Panicum virgatum]|uniref:Uncharacterized protein n=1 Tax=Panicum virgatum TaxID=38727 RepID=A0A8T0SAH1_PANVG|nr:hypothetical protein PVAP13_5NG621101 [Panicum virgatum]
MDSQISTRVPSNRSLPSRPPHAGPPPTRRRAARRPPRLHLHLRPACRRPPRLHLVACTSTSAPPADGRLQLRRNERALNGAAPAGRRWTAAPRACRPEERFHGAVNRALLQLGHGHGWAVATSAALRRRSRAAGEPCKNDVLDMVLDKEGEWKAGGVPARPQRHASPPLRSVRRRGEHDGGSHRVGNGGPAPEPGRGQVHPGEVRRRRDQELPGPGLRDDPVRPRPPHLPRDAAGAEADTAAPWHAAPLLRVGAPRRGQGERDRHEGEVWGGAVSRQPPHGPTQGDMIEFLSLHGSMVSVPVSSARRSSVHGLGSQDAGVEPVSARTAAAAVPPRAR